MRTYITEIFDNKPEMYQAITRGNNMQEVN